MDAKVKESGAPRTPILGGKAVLLSAMLIIAGLIGFFDCRTGYWHPAYFAFYLIPLAVSAWWVGAWESGLVFLVAVSAWWVDVYINPSAYPHPVFPVWDFISRLAVAAALTASVVLLRRAREREVVLVRTDPLTHAANRRHFFELASTELMRAARYNHPFTFILIDLDDFKAINDLFGHVAGDEILDLVAKTIRGCLRTVDTVGRIGADEFGVLLPETGIDAAKAESQRVRGALLGALERDRWSLTFTMCAVTTTTPPAMFDAVMTMADNLVQTGKAEKMSGIRYAVFGVAA
jgi:diguanylate cyclase (GGDEF)-like protein